MAHEGEHGTLRIARSVGLARCSPAFLRSRRVLATVMVYRGLEAGSPPSSAALVPGEACLPTRSRTSPGSITPSWRGTIARDRVVDRNGGDAMLSGAGVSADLEPLRSHR